MAEAMTEAAAMTVDPKYHSPTKCCFSLLFFGCKVWMGVLIFVRVRSMAMAMAVAVAVTNTHSIFLCSQHDQWCHSIPTSQELKKVLLEIYCIEKCLLDRNWI